MTSSRRVLIDNATLSGVERITGISRILNLSNIDQDILCLEKLLTAILFSDEILGIDDYKDAFRSARLQNFDYIKFMKIENSTYNSHAESAAEFARSMVFSFEGSKPAGDVVSFFDALRVDPQLRWDVWVSSEYLTLSFLVKDLRETHYENAIDSAFRNDDADRGLVNVGTNYQPGLLVAENAEISDVKSLIQAFSSGNKNYAGTSGKSALERVIFGYGWAAERSHFYNAVAYKQDADVYLSPLRDAFCESCLRIDYPSQVSSLLGALKKKSQETLVSILGPSGQSQFAMRLPFFAAYLISKVENPKQCINLALKLRDEQDFRKCRALLHNLDHLSAMDRVQEVNTILKYLEQSCSALMKKYAVSAEAGLQFSLSLGLTGINLSAGFKLNELFRSYKNRPFARVFRNIAQDMLNVERLGRLHGKLCSSVQEHSKAMHSSVSVTPKYMEQKTGAHSRPAEL